MAGVEGLQVEPRQLRQAQPAGVEQLEHGLIADGQRFAVVGRVEETTEQVDIDRAGQMARLARCLGQLDRIVVELALADQEVGEARQRRAAPGQGARRQAAGALMRQVTAYQGDVECLPGGNVLGVEPGRELSHVAPIGVERGRTGAPGQARQEGVKRRLHGGARRA